MVSAHRIRARRQKHGDNLRILRSLIPGENLVRIRHLPMQPGDVPATCADIADLARATGFTPQNPDRGWRREVRAVIPRGIAAAGRLILPAHISPAPRPGHGSPERRPG
jgi:hypothetical protein